MSRALRMWLSVVLLAAVTLQDSVLNAVYRLFVAAMVGNYYGRRLLCYFTEHEDSAQFWAEFFIEL